MCLRAHQQDCYGFIPHADILNVHQNVLFALVAIQEGHHSNTSLPSKQATPNMITCYCVNSIFRHAPVQDCLQYQRPTFDRDAVGTLTTLTLQPRPAEQMFRHLTLAMVGWQLQVMKYSSNMYMGLCTAGVTDVLRGLHLSWQGSHLLKVSSASARGKAKTTEA